MKAILPERTRSRMVCRSGRVEARVRVEDGCRARLNQARVLVELLEEPEAVAAAHKERLWGASAASDSSAARARTSADCTAFTGSAAWWMELESKPSSRKRPCVASVRRQRHRCGEAHACLRPPGVVLRLAVSPGLDAGWVGEVLVPVLEGPGDKEDALGTRAVQKRGHLVTAMTQVRPAGRVTQPGRACGVAPWVGAPAVHSGVGAQQHMALGRVQRRFQTGTRRGRRASGQRRANGAQS